MDHTASSRPRAEIQEAVMAPAAPSPTELTNLRRVNMAFS